MVKAETEGIECARHKKEDFGTLLKGLEPLFGKRALNDLDLNVFNSREMEPEMVKWVIVELRRMIWNLNHGTEVAKTCGVSGLSSTS